MNLSKSQLVKENSQLKLLVEKLFDELEVERAQIKTLNFKLERLRVEYNKLGIDMINIRNERDELLQQTK